MTAESRIVIEGLRDFTLRQVTQLAANITAGLIEDTPVDTGWARANWVVSLGVPQTSVVGSRDNVDQSAQQAGISTLLSMTSLGQGPIYISNNVPYIQKLNDGHSGQAPAGFVQSRVDREVRST